MTRAVAPTAPPVPPADAPATVILAALVPVDVVPVDVMPADAVSASRIGKVHR